MRPNLSRVVLIINVAAMQACWIYSLLFLLGAQLGKNTLPHFGLLAFYPLSFCFSRLAGHAGLRRLYRHGLSILVWLAAALFLVKFQYYGSVEWLDPSWLLTFILSIAALIHAVAPGPVILAASGLIWWLGIRHARAKIDFSRSVTEFQFGLAVLVTVLIINSQLGIPSGPLIPVTVIFIVMSLLTLSMAHALEGQAWLTGRNRRYWFVLLFTSITVVLLAGLIISLVINPGMLNLALKIIKYVWMLILKAINFIASLLPAPEPYKMPDMGMPDLPAGVGGGYIGLAIPDSMRRLIGFGTSAVWLILFSIALWRISSGLFNWLRSRLGYADEGEVEQLSGAFRLDLLLFLKKALTKITEFIFRLFRVFRKEEKTGTVSREATSVRKIYRELLKWASAKGCHRNISQTPHEYLSVLNESMPGAEKDFTFITELYARTRYGMSPPSEREMGLMRQLWQGIRKMSIGGKSEWTGH